MRTTAIISILAALLLCAVACSSRGDVEALRRAEAILEDHPDSALALLDAIDPAALRDPDFAALHTLLHLRVSHKLGLGVNVDTLKHRIIARLAHDGNPHHELLVSYYDSWINMELHNYAGSILAAKRAYDLAAAMDSDHFWMAMAARNISDAYNETMSRVEELDYAKLEYYHFAADGRQPHLNYAILDLARAYIGKAEYAKGVELCKRGLDSALVYDDEHLDTALKRLLGMAYLGLNNYKSSIEAYECVRSRREADLEDSLYLGLSYARGKQYAPAKKILESVSDGNDLLKWWLYYEVYKPIDMQRSMLALQKLDSITDDIIYTNKTSNFTGSLVDYYELENKLKQTELSASRTKTLLIGSILLTIVIILAGASAYIIRRLNERIERNVLAAHQMEEAYQVLKNSNVNLLSSKFTFLDSLCQIVFENSETALARRKISGAVTDIINQLSGESAEFDELVDIVNSVHDDIYTKFKTDFPGLKDADYKLFLYTILGFSMNTIALLLGVEKVRSVYERKRRLKDRISSSCMTTASTYLDALKVN